MKNKLFNISAYVSTILFLGFISLFAFVFISDPNPKEGKFGPDWRSIKIGHGSVSIAHSRQITTNTNYPPYVTVPEDGGGSLHITVAKLFWKGELLFLNQNMPEEGMMDFVTPGDTETNRIFYQGFGIEYGSWEHTKNIFGFSQNDREIESIFKGYGVYYRDTSHTVDKVHNWWTLAISLWYPIILLSILPAIFVVKRLRGRKLASFKMKV